MNKTINTASLIPAETMACYCPTDAKPNPTALQYIVSAVMHAMPYVLIALAIFMLLTTAGMHLYPYFKGAL